MSRVRKGRKSPKDVLEILSHLKGVRNAFLLSKAARTGLAKIERRYPSIGPLTVQNDGVLECLKRDHVACIIKDKSFRAPPHSTVVLINDRGEVLGRELLPREKIKKRRGEKVILLGKDFVLFVGRASGKGAKFVLPAVPFKEVEDMEGTRRVISSSPSTIGDLFLRKSAGLEDDPKLASILIGFNLR